jgi:hypothetical protein
MTRLGTNAWGKSAVRVSKVHRGPDGDDFSDLTVQMLLEGEVEAAYRDGDNSAVIPTDTMRNTVYVLAQEHLGSDLEDFSRVLAEHFVARDGVDAVRVATRGGALATGRADRLPGRWVGAAYRPMSCRRGGKFGVGRDRGSGSAQDH